MIVINLVPVELRKRKKHIALKKSKVRLPREAVVGVVGGCLLLLVCAHVALQGVIFSKQVKFKSIQEQKEALAAQKAAVDRVMSELNHRRERVKSVEAVTVAERILWAQKLNLISDNVPPGVWLTRVARDEDNLVIQGTAVSRDGNEMISIHNFQSNLNHTEPFARDFDHIELDMIKSRRIQGVKVSDFTIIGELRKEDL